MNYIVYILKCNDGSYYIGHTNNMENRFIEHQSGKYAGYTASRLPVQLVFTKKFECRDEAFTFERKIKKWNRKKKEALINNDLEALKIYSKKNFHSS